MNTRDPEPQYEQAEVSASEREPVRRSLLMAAETAACTCPEFCERDHDNE